MKIDFLKLPEALKSYSVCIVSSFYRRLESFCRFIYDLVAYVCIHWNE